MSSEPDWKRVKDPHKCHWPGCHNKVPAKLWGCKAHWFKLPYAIREQILATYVPGQETTKTPSVEYIEVAKAAQEWISENNPS